MCEETGVSGELHFNQLGKIASWPFYVEAIAYQLLCISGFAGNVLVLCVHRATSDKQRFTGNSLYRLVSIVLLMSLPLLCARNVFAHSSAVYPLPLDPCISHSVENIVANLLAPFENILLALFLLLVADRYVAVFKPFRRTVLFRSLTYLHLAVALLALVFFLIITPDICANFQQLLELTNSDISPVFERNNTSILHLNFHNVTVITQSQNNLLLINISYNASNGPVVTKFQKTLLEHPLNYGKNDVQIGESISNAQIQLTSSTSWILRSNKVQQIWALVTYLFELCIPLFQIIEGLSFILYAN